MTNDEFVEFITDLTKQYVGVYIVGKNQKRAISFGFSNDNKDVLGLEIVIQPSTSGSIKLRPMPIQTRKWFVHLIQHKGGLETINIVNNIFSFYGYDYVSELRESPDKQQNNIPYIVGKFVIPVCACEKAQC